jgi:hypothetical protein
MMRLVKVSTRMDRALMCICLCRQRRSYYLHALDLDSHRHGSHNHTAHQPFAHRMVV